MHIIRLIPLAFLLAFLSGCSDPHSNENATLWPVNEQCDLHQGACTVEYQGAKVTLKISPTPIPVARPLGIEVDLEGISPTSMQLDISGVNMYMGYNRVPLKSTKPNHWVGTSMLAFCTAETMFWQITLMLDVNGEAVQIPFALTTRNRGE